MRSTSPSLRRISPSPSLSLVSATWAAAIFRHRERPVISLNSQILCQSSYLSPASANERSAEQGHWSECGRATSGASADALGRPHGSVPALGLIPLLDMKRQLLTKSAK